MCEFSIWRYLIVYFMWINCIGNSKGALQLMSRCDVSRSDQCPPQSKCTYRGCDGALCLCNEGYMPLDDYKMCVKIAHVNEQCNNYTRCWLNSRCNNSTCVCQSGFYLHNRTCLQSPIFNAPKPSLGDSCDDVRECQLNFLCNPLTRVCECPEGLVQAPINIINAYPFSTIFCVPKNFTLGKQYNKKDCPQVVISSTTTSMLSTMSKTTLSTTSTSIMLPTTSTSKTTMPTTSTSAMTSTSPTTVFVKTTSVTSRTIMSTQRNKSTTNIIPTERKTTTLSSTISTLSTYIKPLTTAVSIPQTVTSKQSTSRISPTNVQPSVTIPTSVPPFFTPSMSSSYEPPSLNSYTTSVKMSSLVHTVRITPDISTLNPFTQSTLGLSTASLMSSELVSQTRPSASFEISFVSATTSVSEIAAVSHSPSSRSFPSTTLTFSSSRPIITSSYVSSISSSISSSSSTEPHQTESLSPEFETSVYSSTRHEIGKNSKMSLTVTSSIYDTQTSIQPSSSFISSQTLSQSNSSTTSRTSLSPSSTMSVTSLSPASTTNRTSLSPSSTTSVTSLSPPSTTNRTSLSLSSTMSVTSLSPSSATSVTSLSPSSSTSVVITPITLSPTTSSPTTVSPSLPCGHSSDCPDNAKCAIDQCGQQKCRCNVGYELNGDQTKCLKIIDLGQPCSAHTICLGPNSRCMDGQCQCDYGYLPDFTYRRCKRRTSWFIEFPLLSEQCSSFFKECHNAFEQECKDEMCKCKEGLREMTNKERKMNYLSYHQCINNSVEVDTREVLKCGGNLIEQEPEPSIDQAKKRIQLMEGLIIGGGLLVALLLSGIVAMILCIRHKRRVGDMMSETSSVASFDRHSEGKYSFRIPRPFASPVLYAGTMESDVDATSLQNPSYDDHPERDRLRDEEHKSVNGTMARGFRLSSDDIEFKFYDDNVTDK